MVRLAQSIPLFMVVRLCKVTTNTESGNPEALPVGEIQG